MQHPIDLVYRHLTSILEPFLGDKVETKASCTCCSRPAEQFGFAGYVGRDSYKQPFVHCPACRSFTVTDIDTMGVERLAAGVPVGQKFGMWVGVGWVHELEPGRSTLLAPPGVYAKLPASFLRRVNTIEITESGHLNWLANNATFPLVYIRSFGRKTKELISGLTISPSPRQLVVCSDDGLDSITRVTATIDLPAAQGLSEQMSALSNAEQSAFSALVRDLASGRVSPLKATESIKKQPYLGELLRLLPVDPHQRLQIMRLTAKLRG